MPQSSHARTEFEAPALWIKAAFDTLQPLYQGIESSTGTQKFTGSFPFSLKQILTAKSKHMPKNTLPSQQVVGLSCGRLCGSRGCPDVQEVLQVGADLGRPPPPSLQPLGVAVPATIQSSALGCSANMLAV